MKYPLYKGQEICFCNYSILNETTQIYSIVLENFMAMAGTISCVCEDCGECKMVLHTDHCVPWEMRDEQ